MPRSTIGPKALFRLVHNFVEVDGKGEGCRVAEIRGEPNALLDVIFGL